MSNRVMKQKTQKMRRQRRAWAKEYSRPSGITVNRGVLQEYKERACGLGVSEFEIDELIRKLYKRDPIHGVAAGRVEVLALLKELKQSVPEMLFFTILDNCFHHAVCFFNSTKTCFVITHTDLRKCVTRRSIEYGSKERAIHQWHHDKVIWVSCKSVKSDQVSAPP